MSEPSWSRDMQARASERTRRTEPVVSSAENDKPTGRLVWIDDRLAAAIAYAQARAEADWKDAEHAAELGEILAAWDIEPADPTEATCMLVFRMLKEWPDDEDDGDFAFRVAQSVLAALGVPDTNAERKIKP